MNYTGYEVLRNEVAQVSNEFCMMSDKLRKLLDDKIKRNSDNLVENLTVRMLLDIHNDFAHLCRRLYDLDSQFLD